LIGRAFAFLAVLGFCYQVCWAALITRESTFRGHSPCGVYNERDFLQVSATGLDSFYGPGFLGAAVISILLLLRAAFVQVCERPSPS
jgi:hypothetical protein